MKNVRGIIALAVAITLGFIAVQAVSFYLNKPAVVKQVKQVKKKDVPKPGLFSSLPEGMRVVTIKVNDMSGVSRRLKKGDMVDVVSSSGYPGKTDGGISRIILKGVKDYRFGEASSELTENLVSKKRLRTVSLVLSPDDAALLFSASKGSDISLMFCNDRIKPEEYKPEKSESLYVYDCAGGAQKISDTGKDYSRDIPEGMRAVTIEIVKTDGICGIIRPGDFVDIILSSQLSRIAGDDFTAGEMVEISKNEMVSKLILQKIKVIATDTALKPINSGGEPVKLVTLIAKPQDAVILAATTDAVSSGRTKAKIKLIARGSNDSTHARTEMVNPGDLLQEKYYRPSKIVVYKGTKIQVRYF